MANEEAIAEEFDLKPEEQELEQVETKKEEEQVDEPVIPTGKDTAEHGGWQDKEHWQGEPEDFIDWPEFNRRGELINAIKAGNTKIRGLEQASRDQLVENNVFHQRQTQILERQIKDLEAERTKAIDLADVPEADRIQSDIDDLKGSVNESKAAVTTVPAGEQETHPSIAAWNEKNPWAMGDDAKADNVRGEWNRIFKAGWSNGCDMNQLIDDSITKLDTFVTKKYPVKNANRDAPATTLRGRSTHRQPGVQLTMADLTHTEKMNWDEFGHAYKDEKEFLKAATNARITDEK